MQEGSGRPPFVKTEVEKKALALKLETDGMTQKKLVEDVGAHPDTLRKHTRRCKENPNGAYPRVTPLESPISDQKKHFRLLYVVVAPHNFSFMLQI